MRKLLRCSILLALACMATVAGAQSPCTTVPNTGAPLSLNLPNTHCTGWDVPLNQNFTLINQFASQVPLLSPTVSQTITQPSGTYFNINGLQVFASRPYIAFGVSPSTPTGFLTEVSAGNFTLDASVFGAAGGSLQLNSLNMNSFALGGAAPLNHLLVGDGSFYRDSSSIPASAVSGLPTYTFSSSFSTSVSGSNTTVSLASTGVTPGTYTSVTVNGNGQVTSGSSGGSRICNSNGCYVRSADGTIVAWGVVVGTFPSATVLNVAINYPINFSTAVSPVVTGGGQPDGTDDVYTVYLKNPSLSGATIVARCAVNIGGSGCPGSLSNSVPFYWQATGY